MKVISLFSGTGGSSCGYRMAGCKVLLAVEMDENAIKNYKLNFPTTNIFEGDIAKLNIEKKLEELNLKRGELDLLDGSPPCQGFSTAGRRVLDDPRNMLFKEYIRILKATNPKAFLMENVSGMVKGKMKLIFTQILEELKACGYEVKAKLMNASYYSVPQARQRLIFIGYRKDLNKTPSYPKVHDELINCREALKNIKSNNLNDIPKIKGITSQIWNKIKPGEDGPVFFGGKRKYFNTIKVNPLKACPTISKSSCCLLHWNEKRYFSIDEAKRLQSFPDDFKLIGSYAEKWARIGNSVPPLLIKAVAEHIKKDLGL